MKKTKGEGYGTEIKNFKYMDKIRYINMCIVEFGRKFGMPASMAYNYLRAHKALDFLDECYAAEHTLSLEDALDDMQTISRRHGGTI